MKKLFPVLLAILVIPAIFYLLWPGFYESDDGEWMVIRFTSFYQELSHFQIPVRFLNRLNNGYGYPVATFLYPGFMYLASIFKILGFGFVASVKSVLVLSIVSGFIGMFLFLTKHFSKISAVVGACLYIYSPYFLWDIYKRGSIGEVLVLGIVPVILYSIDSDQRVIASLLTAAVIISHNTLALLFLPFILLYMLITQLSQKVHLKIILLRLLIFSISALGVSAFFWVPAITELQFTVFGNTTISNFQEYFLSNQFLVGVINVVILISLLIYLIFKRKYSLVLYLMLCTSLLSLFLSYGISSFLWSSSFLGKLVQFPFRFLSIFTLATAYLGAFLFSKVKEYTLLLAIICIGFIIVNIFPFISNVQIKEVTDSYYSTNVDTTTVRNEYMPRWAKTVPQNLPAREIEHIDKNTVQVNTIYWPGYSVLVDGKKVPIDYSNEHGLMRVATTEPLEKIAVTFQETTLRLMSNIFSLLSLGFTAILLFKKNAYV